VVTIPEPIKESETKKMQSGCCGSSRRRLYLPPCHHTATMSWLHNNNRPHTANIHSRHFCLHLVCTANRNTLKIIIQLIPRRNDSGYPAGHDCDCAKIDVGALSTSITVTIQTDDENRFTGEEPNPANSLRTEEKVPTNRGIDLGVEAEQRKR
jgi:hypothetical protein